MKPRLLDLFCGAGGCSVGYARAGFEVIGIDIVDQPNYPLEFIQDDAIGRFGAMLESWQTTGVEPFDAIHASPPCQAHSAVTGEHRDKHVDLIPETRRLLKMSKLPYAIENVVGAPLENPITLCGSSFGLPLRRHRLFETNFPILAPPCAHGGQERRFDIYEHGKWRKSATPAIYGKGGRKAVEHWPEALGIDWMTRDEMAQAIPPAYTEFIGGYLMAAVKQKNPVRW